MGFFAKIIQKGPFSGDFEKFPKNRLSEMDCKGLSQVTWMLNTPEKLGFRAFSGGGNNFHFSKRKPFPLPLLGLFNLFIFPLRSRRFTGEYFPKHA
jgi:hypothetical protein